MLHLPPPPKTFSQELFETALSLIRAQGENILNHPIPFSALKKFKSKFIYSHINKEEEMKLLTKPEESKLRAFPIHKEGVQVFKVDHMNQQMQEVKAMTEFSKQLLQLPHYKKIGQESVFLIVENALSLGLDPRKALNGGLYVVNGKIEMSGRLMAELIRKAGHSIRTEENSNQKCTLVGKRADNGDEEKASFSIDEAKKAGIYRNTWEKFPEDMLYWRALSRLARRLFSDVIGGCYIQGELRDSNYSANSHPTTAYDMEIEVTPSLSGEQVKEIESLLKKFSNCEGKTQEILDYFEVENLSQLPIDRFDRIKRLIKTQTEQLNKEEPIYE